MSLKKSCKSNQNIVSIRGEALWNDDICKGISIVSISPLEQESINNNGLPFPLQSPMMFRHLQKVNNYDIGKVPFTINILHVLLRFSIKLEVVHPRLL